PEGQGQGERRLLLTRHEADHLSQRSWQGHHRGDDPHRPGRYHPLGLAGALLCTERRLPHIVVRCDVAVAPLPVDARTWPGRGILCHGDDLRGAAADRTHRSLCRRAAGGRQAVTYDRSAPTRRVSEGALVTDRVGAEQRYEAKKGPRC